MSNGTQCTVLLSDKHSIEAALLEIRPLAAEDAGLLREFSCGDDDLDDFIRTDALRLQEKCTANTFVAIYQKKLIGFISLLTDAVLLETGERKQLALTSRDHPLIPALKIARLGVSIQFRASCRGTGTLLVNFARAKALSILAHAGCHLLTVDAYQQSVRFYERLGFVANRAKVYRDRSYVSMRRDVLKSRSAPEKDGGT